MPTAPWWTCVLFPASAWATWAPTPSGSARSWNACSRAERAGPVLKRLLQILALALPAALATASNAEVDYLSFATDDEANSTEIFSKASPSVVFVTNTALRRNFFSLDVQEIPQGAGTGFIWDKSGLVVTNFHVIAGAHKVIVTLQDRSEHSAEIIGLAPEKDLAVLRMVDPP
ncbi:MAG: trypsin-like peptidase domain-containing protein, partial [Halioglobus sp.]|nr:trypsin-like peptidase domain-containing protein [Halioglobus sp.]